ncbi:MAG: NTP transferase domain-containing protein [Candidatus Marinimicrobia bacterium]|nr:NTP transferase domain-containing protein [Candidatus Neomarinimicrobiota bacterium]
MCKNIIDNHRGSITVKSTVGKGTTVSVSFPILEQEDGKKAGISGAILAGGKSSRIGTDKALLKLDGQTLIERAITTLRPYTGDPIIIANAPDKYNFLNLSVYPDIIADTGPLGGILTALEKSNTTHCMVLACDLPFVSGELIKILWNQGLVHDVTVVDAGFGVEPLCAVYSKRCLSPIRKQLDLGQYRVTNFYHYVDVKVIYLEQLNKIFTPEILLNINTPEDLENARAQLKVRES